MDNTKESGGQRAKYLMVRLSPAEHALIDAWAKRKGIVLSKWVRRNVLQAAKDGGATIEQDFDSEKRDHVSPATGKTKVSINLDNDVLEALRAMADERGQGYQALIKKTLLAAVRLRKRSAD